MPGDKQDSKETKEERTVEGGKETNDDNNQPNEGRKRRLQNAGDESLVNESDLPAKVSRTDTKYKTLDGKSGKVGDKNEVDVKDARSKDEAKDVDSKKKAASSTSLCSVVLSQVSVSGATSKSDEKGESGPVEGTLSVNTNSLSTSSPGSQNVEASSSAKNPSPRSISPSVAPSRNMEVKSRDGGSSSPVIAEENVTKDVRGSNEAAENAGQADANSPSGDCKGKTSSRGSPTMDSRGDKALKTDDSLENPGKVSEAIDAKDRENGGTDIAGQEKKVSSDSSSLLVPKVENTADDEAGTFETMEATADAVKEERREDSTNVEHPRKRKLKTVRENGSYYPSPTAPFRIEEQCFSNPFEIFVKIRKHLEIQRRQLVPVHPKPPQGYKDYLIHRGTYVLDGNQQAQLAAATQVTLPYYFEQFPDLAPFKELFIAQEKEREKLRLRHLVEKEKLVLCVEQEILRVHGRAARALANQALPFSACTMLRDAVLSNPPPPPRDPWQNPHQMLCYPSCEEGGSSRDRTGLPTSNGAGGTGGARSRYNGRLFLSWLQDVDDKWEKIKSGMVLRHHNEAEALQVVQQMDWELKVQEMGLSDELRAADGVTSTKGRDPRWSQWPAGVIRPDDRNIPIVHVSDDFDLLPA
ncbi:unnamed protein product [Notodromas monacha]|uniref:Ankyrin repeat domain-containing protein 11 n=1 Tax=Notodromas monacha TaxID=399045 RepID=A0A7R9BPR3_9CRUS|nr:unnamed protein product [Notodromas monacha]CAG0919377.1 unnamed protein product [Notodromas monacha]